MPNGGVIVQTEKIREMRKDREDLRSFLVFWAMWALLQTVESATAIRSGQSCYVQREQIDLAFTNDNPMQLDWVAIVPSNAIINPFSVDDVFDWSSTCGSKSCTQRSLASGQVILESRRLFVGDGRHLMVTKEEKAWLVVPEGTP